MKISRSMSAAAALLVLCYPLLAVAQGQQPTNPPWDWPGPWHMWHGAWGFGWWIFPLFMFLMMLVCVGHFFFSHGSSGGRSGKDQSSQAGRSWGDPTSSALEILNERLARGEIEKPEYEDKKAVILSRAGHSSLGNER